MSDLERVPDWMLADTTGPQPLNLQTWAQEFRDVYQISEALCKTPFVPAAMLGRQADVAAAIMKGRELGLDPFDALGSIYIVHGRVGYYAEFLRRRIIQAGHTLRIVETSDNRCIIEGTRKDTGETHRATFTAEQARKGGIDITKFPSDKLIARATSRLCKQAFPDVLSGSLIAEDLIDGVIPTADTTEPEPTPTPRPAVQRKRATKPAKAAATQPKPKTRQPEPDNDDDDTAQLLDDTPHDRPPPADQNETLPVSQSHGHDTPPLPAQSRALSGPAAAEPPPDEDRPRMITAPQLTKLSILLKEAGFHDRETRHAFVTTAIGRHIDSANELTLDEASTVIDILENGRETQ